MSRYRDWGSGFYEDAYANPPKNPLAGLEEVTLISLYSSTKISFTNYINLLILSFSPGPSSP